MVKLRKPSNIYRKKASSLRSSWTARAKRYNLSKRSIPSLDSLEKWIRKQEPFTCFYSGLQLGWNWQAEHKIPVSRKGSFGIRNLAISSERMNACKGKMTDTEFFEILNVIKKWPDKGEYLLSKLKQSSNIFKRK